MRKNISKSLVALLCTLGLVISLGEYKEVVAVQKRIQVSSQQKENDKVISITNENDNELTIFEVTDIHYISNNISDKGEAFQRMLKSADGRETYYIEELTDALVYEIEQKKPDVLIVSGDLTHNGEKESHIEIAKKLSKIEESGTKVLVTPGNHDINNPYAREFKGKEQIVTESITAEEFEQIYYNFGFSDAIMRDGESLSYLSKVSNDLFILMLDTNLYEQNEKYPIANGVLTESTLDWVKRCGDLAEKSGGEILGVMHHNLYNHSDLLYEGYTIDNSEEVLNVFKDSGINLVLSGYIHVQDIAFDEDKTVFDVVTSGFVVYPVSYGNLVYSKENGFVYDAKDVDVEAWAKSTKNDDENLLNFREYSKENFYNQSYKMVYRRLFDYEIFDDEEIEEAKLMADTMAILNVHYFGGTVSEIDKELGMDILDTEGYKLWVKNSYDYFAKYVLGMAETKDKMATDLELSSEVLKR